MRGLGNRGDHQQKPSTSASYADNVGARTAIRASSGRTPATPRRAGLLPPEDEPHRLQARRRALEGGRHRPLDDRGWVGLHQPQHPDPFLVGLAGVLRQLGPHPLPHRAQSPVERRHRLGHGPMLALQQRQHVKRIEDPRAPHERPGCSATTSAPAVIATRS